MAQMIRIGTTKKAVEKQVEKLIPKELQNGEKNWMILKRA
jgi:hypothetical protein